MEIRLQEQRDSVRIVWNSMPSSKTLQAKVAVPQCLHYTPLSQRQQPVLDYHPPKCRECQAYLNFYNRISKDKQQFKCCICKANNSLPQNYIQGSKQYPRELSSDFSSFTIAQTISLNTDKTGFLFVIDKSLVEKQLESIKQAVIELIDSLSNDERVGLITYDKMTYLYDLTSKVNKIEVISPHCNQQTIEIARLLGISENNNKIANKYIVKLGDCRQNLISCIKSLRRANLGYKNQRDAIVTGQTLNLALSLNQLSPAISRIVFFCGKVCTVGEGKIISQDYKIEMRSIRDSFPRQSIKAKQFYNKLVVKAMSKGVPIDSFIFSIQQAGLTQMAGLLTCTGGLLIQHQQFDSAVFRESFRKAYIGIQDFPKLERALFTTLSVNHSSEISITNMLWNNNESRQTPTKSIIIGSIDQSKCISIMYQLSQTKVQSQVYYIQIRTGYVYPENNSIVFERITTIRRPFRELQGDIAAGFDQEAALALIAKLAIRRSVQTQGEQLRKWIDNILCKWASLFSIFNNGDCESFRLPANMKRFPQFIYHLRRNSIIRKKGLSLDELTYISLIVSRETVQNIVTIIQPALLEYTPQHLQAHPISLDQKYMKNESILILDSYFNVIQWRGLNMQSYIQQNLHTHQQYKYLVEIFKNTENDIKSIKNDRFPVPNYYLTATGHSKERFIKSRLSSRESHQKETNLSQEADSTSFTEHLIEMIVNRKV